MPDAMFKFSYRLQNNFNGRIKLKWLINQSIEWFVGCPKINRISIFKHPLSLRNNVSWLLNDTNMYQENHKPPIDFNAGGWI